jgi:predicted Rossmann-fold nucleotide-binding protein
MQIAFTGSRNYQPATDDEKVLTVLYGISRNAFLVTGGCIGVDAAVARIGTQMGFRVHTILPADRSRVDPEWRIWCDTFEEMPQGTSYKDRNVRLVVLADSLIAFPSQPETHNGPRGSGTWQTVRLARRANKVVTIYPLW